MTDPAVAKLQALVRIPTVSDRDPARVDTEVFDAFLAEHARLFPRLYAALELTRVGTHGLLFHWAGASSERPVVLMAHLDVVPVDESAPWQHPPFGAEIHDGAVWGRGTLDDKGCLVAICEAVERLLADGFTPAQDLWLSFGSDEEVFGTAASEAVAELSRRGVRAVVRGRRGRSHRGRGVPGHQAARRRDRRDGEGRHERGAPGRGPRRPRVDAGEVRADRAAGPRHPACRPLPHGGAHPRRDGRPVPPARSARTAAPAAGDEQRRTAAAGRSRGRSSRPVRSRPR